MSERAGLIAAIATLALALGPLRAHATLYQLPSRTLLRAGLASGSARPALVAPGAEPAPEWMVWLLALYQAQPLTLGQPRWQGHGFLPEDRWSSELELGFRGHPALGWGPAVRWGTRMQLGSATLVGDALAIWNSQGPASALDARLELAPWRLEAHRLAPLASSPLQSVRLSWERRW